jgi:O-antigen/teichoic acid export membrane protein
MAVPLGSRAREIVLALCREQSYRAFPAFDPHPFGSGDAMSIAGIAEGRCGGASGGDTIRRYGASVLGPAAVSAAHFLVSLILLHAVPAGQFGLFSFVMVVMGLGLSVNAALISVPLSRNLATGDGANLPAYFQMNWLVCGAIAVLLFGALLASGASRLDAALLALFSGIFTFRWFARCFAYVENRIAPALQSDLIYGLTLAGSMAALAASHGVSLTLGAETLLLSALAALLPFGPGFFRRQVAALTRHPKHYGPVFRDITRWSLAGVVTTELTANAHVYLVTFIAGPTAFAPLALGMLLLRPASLMQSALPDLERPRMARAIAAGNATLLSRIRRHFSLGLLTVWIVNILLCAGLLLGFPELVTKKGYDIDTIIPVTILCALIVALRSLRTPPAVLLQATGAFKSLAGISAAAAALSLTLTLGLLLAFGATASLGGILLGELAILMPCYAKARISARMEMGHG